MVGISSNSMTFPTMMKATTITTTCRTKIHWIILAYLFSTTFAGTFSVHHRTIIDSLSKITTTTTTNRLSPHATIIAFKQPPSYLSVRGGGGASSEDFEDYSEDDDFDEDLFDDADFDTMENDFDEESSLDRVWENWKKTPPLTKTYLSASVAITLFGYLTNKNQYPEIFLLDWKPTLTKLQLWRPFTAFLNFGPMGIGYLLTGQFVWTYMSTLERLNHDKPYDFWIMILFGCVTMVMGYSVLKIPPMFLGHNLSTFLVYVWSRYHEGLEVNMMELFNTRAEMLPWFFSSADGTVGR